MKSLEQRLGFPVLTRAGRRVELTPRARQYVAEIAPALKTLSEAGGMTEISGTVRLNVAPGFALSWLAPRIGGFTAAHPGLNVTMNAPRGYGDLGTRDEDLYITFLPQALAPPDAVHLMDVAFFPVAAPHLTAGRSFNSVSQVLDYPLLHLDGPQDWSSWAGAAGWEGDLPQGGVIFQDIAIMAAAARAGQGVALGDALTSSADLARGELIRLHPHDWPSPRSYWLIEGAKPQSEGRRAFTEWLQAALSA